jgi:hypothetical protein
LPKNAGTAKRTELKIKSQLYTKFCVATQPNIKGIALKAPTKTDNDVTVLKVYKHSCIKNIEIAPNIAVFGLIYNKVNPIMVSNLLRQH